MVDAALPPDAPQQTAPVMSELERTCRTAAAVAVTQVGWEWAAAANGDERRVGSDAKVFPLKCVRGGGG